MTHPTIVSAAWLWERRHDPHIAIADCRFSLLQPEQGQQQYNLSHIPGAYYLDLNQDLSSPVSRHGGRHPLPDVAALVSTLVKMGVHSAPPHGPTLVVAYDDSRQGFAARLWWLLRYLGHDHVVVLDGGFAAWQDAGYPVTTEIPAAQVGQFIARVRPDMMVNVEQVKSRQFKAGVVLVDSREPERYRGEREPIDPVAGHIPGAVNYPWQDVTDTAGFVRSPDEQHQRWAEIESADEIVVYCGSGVTACVNLLSLELAGIKTGKLYAGSWSDWCSYL